MLLNLSNHPSQLWDEKQKLAARVQFGQIVDLAFPDVSPEADTSEIEKLADTYFIKCVESTRNSSDTKNAIHLMGEMTLTFVLVARLQQSGLVCIASTSHRKVINNVKGEKTVMFEFCRFRNYPLLTNITKTNE